MDIEKPKEETTWATVEEDIYIKVSLSFEENELVNTESSAELIELIEYYTIQKENAHLMAESGRALGYSENHIVVQLAKQEWKKAADALDYYTTKYELLKEKQETEYPNAAYVWNYLKDLGYNDYVCAGIMGNLMAEVGGQTLALDIDAVNGIHYGICQWNKRYYGSVWGTDLATQCDFLRDNIEYEIDKYGSNFKRDFDYSDFLALTNEQDAALAFCMAYERCGASSYEVRQKNATKAYKYFVS